MHNYIREISTAVFIPLDILACIIHEGCGFFGADDEAVWAIARIPWPARG